jgi:hypothetical protein
MYKDRKKKLSVKYNLKSITDGDKIFGVRLHDRVEITIRKRSFDFWKFRLCRY